MHSLFSPSIFWFAYLQYFDMSTKVPLNLRSYLVRPTLPQLASEVMALTGNSESRPSRMGTKFFVQIQKFLNLS